MPHSAVRGLVVLLGVMILVADVVQDWNHVQSVSTVDGWTNRLLLETLALLVRNLLMLTGLVLKQNSAGWKLLALIAVFAIVRRGFWFTAMAPQFDSVNSVAFQMAFSTADFLFRLLCLVIVVDLVRGAFHGVPPEVPPEEK